MPIKGEPLRGRGDNVHRADDPPSVPTAPATASTGTDARCDALSRSDGHARCRAREDRPR